VLIYQRGVFGGARLADNLHDTALLSGTGLAVEARHATSADHVIDDSLEQLSRTLFARITECVINHENKRVAELL
jgi:hypothetical protein